MRYYKLIKRKVIVFLIKTPFEYGNKPEKKVQEITVIFVLYFCYNDSEENFFPFTYFDEENKQ